MADRLAHDHRKGFWAVTIHANWRIIFRFDDGDVLDVDLIDYH
jgi:proteic killer suppression protein